MKNNHRYILGLVSSFLLICGFARAAERLDPVRPSHLPRQANVSGIAPACATFCNATDSNTSSVAPSCAMFCNVVEPSASSAAPSCAMFCNAVEPLRPTPACATFCNAVEN